MKHAVAAALAAIATAATAAAASAGARIAAWNITFYSGGLAQQIARIGYDDAGPTREPFAPDLILLQEMSGAFAVQSLANHLNTPANSPGDWVAAPTFDNGNIVTGLVYREGAFDLLDSTLVASGSSSANPRNIVRYDLRLDGYTSEEATFAMYPTHMKAGSSGSDQSRRQIEAQRIVADLVNIPAGRHYILGGDFNTQSSGQQSHRTLVGTIYNTGPFRDPISRPGAWQNNSSFRVIHTQDPASQMDDRYDMILLSPSLLDGLGADYIGDFPTPFDLSRWDDPNHSYRALGNDGTTYNNRLRTLGNAAVSSTVAQDLITQASNSGHVPVYLDLLAPARTAVPQTSIDLGNIAKDRAIDFDLEIGSAGDIARWGVHGIEPTEFTLETGRNLDASAFAGADAPGGPLQTITLTLDTAGLPTGTFGTMVNVLSNDVDNPFTRVDITANITDPACSPADVVPPFGVLDLGDLDAFIIAFAAGDPIADVAQPQGVLDLDDIDTFILAFLNGCP